MSEISSLRFMLLINHTAIRDFSVKMLGALGVKNIFTPKRFPADLRFVSASVDYELDNNLAIPSDELTLLNSENWYGDVSPKGWEIANANFDIAVVMPWTTDFVLRVNGQFKGGIVWHEWGLPLIDENFNNIELLSSQDTAIGESIRAVGKRFFLAHGYSTNLETIPRYLRRQTLCLPLGISHERIRSEWSMGTDLIYFLCPEIGSDPASSQAYAAFRSNLGHLPYVVAGQQPLPVDDPRVLGAMADTERIEKIRQSRMVFFDSGSTKKLFLDVLECICVGVPVIFMRSNGAAQFELNQLAGCCKDLNDLRSKIRKLLSGDIAFVQTVLRTQESYIAKFMPEQCMPIWDQSLQLLSSGLAKNKVDSYNSKQGLLEKRPRIAIIVPVNYRGGSLRGAIALAKALYVGSRQCSDDAEIVFAHCDESAAYDEEIPSGVQRRIFQWKKLTASEARRAMRYAGHDNWEPQADEYQVPDDGMRQFVDCDLWLFISDRVALPLLPIKPVVLMVYDYLQRYEKVMDVKVGMPFIELARSAKKVFVTTSFTKNDAEQYAGVSPRRVRKVPLLAPLFFSDINEKKGPESVDSKSYFLWTTNSSVHKNHRNAAEALKIYYEELDGVLRCKVSGVNTQDLLGNQSEHTKLMAEVFRSSSALSSNVAWLGELSDMQYRHELAGAAFLWHAGRIDNGTFCVVEAASLGVPSLSSDYPAMREIDFQFRLNLSWMPPSSPKLMARALKKMEYEALNIQLRLPPLVELSNRGVESHAQTYWSEVRACL